MKLERSFYIPEGSKEVTRPGVNAVAYEYENNGKLCARGFKGKSIKPTFAYYFGNEEQRQRYINEWFDGLEFRAERDKREAAERQEKMAKACESVKIGDIFYCSWGYDQTNVDYYKVIDKKAKSVVVVEIGASVVDSERTSETVEPNPSNVIGKPMLKRLNGFGGFRVTSYSNAYPWDGKPKYQTAYGFGH